MNKKKNPGLLTKLQKKQQMILNSELSLAELSSMNYSKRGIGKTPEVESFKEFSSDNNDEERKSIQSISNIKDSVDFILSNPSE